MVKHADYDWINKKIDGHGGAYSHNDANGRAKITYIGSKNRLQIFAYNLYLFIRYLKRRIEQH